MRLTFPAAWLIVLMAFPCAAFGQEDEGGAVDEGREALHRAGDFPWYDRQRDEVRRVDVAPRGDARHRASRWEWQPRSWDFPDWIATLIKVLAWSFLIALLGLLIYYMVRAFTSYENRSVDVRTAPSSARVGDVDRVESLPFQLRQPQANLLDEARRLYEAGQFGQAIVYLYSYQLIQLDKHQLIRLAIGKTNRQYLRETRRWPAIQALLEKTMVAFEDVFFGNHSLDRNRFEISWRALDEFHQRLMET